MSNDDLLSKIKARISSLPDQELLDIIEIDFEDYRKEAIEFAKQELARRDIPCFPLLLPGASKPKLSQERKSEPCEKCGSRARHGVLFENREIIFLFDDVEERRFLDVWACRSCGYVKLNVDLATGIEDYERAPAPIGGSSNSPDGKHRCPHCGWQPDEDCEWYCDKCGCYWNTFETHGRCPTCNYLWAETACSNCGEWSAHNDWYVEQKSES